MSETRLYSPVMSAIRNIFTVYCYEAPFQMNKKCLCCSAPYFAKDMRVHNLFNFFFVLLCWKLCLRELFMRSWQFIKNMQMTLRIMRNENARGSQQWQRYKKGESDFITIFPSKLLLFFFCRINNC